MRWQLPCRHARPAWGPDTWPIGSARRSQTPSARRQTCPNPSVSRQNRRRARAGHDGRRSPVSRIRRHVVPAPPELEGVPDLVHDEAAARRRARHPISGLGRPALAVVVEHHGPVPAPVVPRRHTTWRRHREAERRTAAGDHVRDEPLRDPVGRPAHATVVAREESGPGRGHAERRGSAGDRHLVGASRDLTGPAPDVPVVAVRVTGLGQRQAERARRARQLHQVVRRWDTPAGPPCVVANREPVLADRQAEGARRTGHGVESADRQHPQRTPAVHCAGDCATAPDGRAEGGRRAGDRGERSEVIIDVMDRAPPLAVVRRSIAEGVDHPAARGRRARQRCRDTRSVRAEMDRTRPVRPLARNGRRGTSPRGRHGDRHACDQPRQGQPPSSFPETKPVPHLVLLSSPETSGRMPPTAERFGWDVRLAGALRVRHAHPKG